MTEWEPYQRMRLAIEREILAANLPDFTMQDVRRDPRVEGSWKTSSGRTYGIVVTLPPGFPDECPSTYVTDPFPLLDHDDLPLTRHGSNHAMHLWVTDRPQWTRVCTYRPESWSASHSLEKVVHKTLLWLEAYEAHCVTGRPIADYLLEMP